MDDEDDAEEYKGIEVERKGKEGDNAIIKKLMDPREPSEQEVEDHELYHVPYRNWWTIGSRWRKNEGLLSTHSTTASPGTSSAIS